MIRQVCMYVYVCTVLTLRGEREVDAHGRIVGKYGVKWYAQLHVEETRR